MADIPRDSGGKAQLMCVAQIADRLAVTHVETWLIYDVKMWGIWTVQLLGLINPRFISP